MLLRVIAVRTGLHRVECLSKSSVQLFAHSIPLGTGRLLSQSALHNTSSSVSTAGANANVTSLMNAVLSSLTSAVLRAASTQDPALSVSAGPVAAFAESHETSTESSMAFCGNALSLTVQRLSTTAMATVTLARPMLPCSASNSSPATLPAPYLHVEAMLLQAVGGGASSLDISIAQVGSRAVFYVLESTRRVS
jgi:hypothetical protein